MSRELSGNSKEYSGPQDPCILPIHFYGYRYMDPLTGRWPSRDPIGEKGGVNLYQYGPNSPTSGIDFLGSNWFSDDVEEIKVDVNSLLMEVGNVQDGLAQTEGFDDWDVKADFDHTFWSWITNGDTCVLTLAAKAPKIKLVRRADTNPDQLQDISDPSAAINPRNEKQRTVLQHERDHASQLKSNWNTMIALIKPYKGKYCPCSCATLAKNVVDKTSSYYHDLAKWQAELYDFAAYGGHLNLANSNC